MKVICFPILIIRNVNGKVRYSGDAIFDLLGNKDIDECLDKAEEFCRKSSEEFNCEYRLEGCYIKDL